MTRIRGWVLAFAAAAAGCHSEAVPPEKPPRPVRVGIAEAPPPAAGARFSANIVAGERVLLAFRSPGYVEQILQVRGTGGGLRDVLQGDAIVDGTVLAQVRQDDYRARVAQAEARVAEATAAVTKAREDLERAGRLFEARSLTRPDLDAARLASETAEARLAAARAEAALADIALRDTALRAPLDAIVLERNVERGSLVGTGTVGFTLADVRSVKAVFGVPDALVPTLRPGLPLTLTSDAIRGRDFVGRVTAISPAADPQTRVFTIEVTVANTDRVLRPGMIATAHLDTGTPAGAAAGRVAVPLAAIVKHEPSPGGYALFTLEERGGGAVARARTITLGDVVGNAVEVTDGVRQGERIVIAGASLLKDGEPVRVIP
jgi:multidrug efflux system membrane fusion protein